jgi:hypothetical protein
MARTPARALPYIQPRQLDPDRAARSVYAAAATAAAEATMQVAALQAAALLAAAAVAAAGICVVDDNNIGAAANCIDANTDTCTEAAACGDATNWNTSGLIDGLSTFGVGGGIDGGTAFYNRNLTMQDISDWDMSAVITLEAAFYNCLLSPSTDLGSWDVSSVTNFNNAFSYGNGDNTMYTNLHIGNWTITAETTDMSSAFSRRANFLTTDDVGGWDVSSVTNFDYTFYDNANFAGNGLEKWAVSNEANTLDSMFSGCNLTDVNLTSWDVSSVTVFAGTFAGNQFFVGNGLESWKVSSNATTIEAMFYQCNLGTVDLSGWDVSSVISFVSTFDGGVAPPLGNVNFLGTGLNNWPLDKSIGNSAVHYMLKNTNVTAMPTSWFTGLGAADCAARWQSVFEVYTDNYNGVLFPTCGESCVVDDDNIGAAANCIDANSITPCNSSLAAACDTATNWNTSGVTTMASAFANKDLRLQDISDWDMSAVTTLDRAFNGCLLSNTTDLGSWDVSRVTDFDFAFRYSGDDPTMYTNLRIGNWTINSAEITMDYAFSGRTNFFVNDPTIGQLDMAGVTTLDSAFKNCLLSNTTDLGSWDVSRVTSFYYAFYHDSGDPTMYTNLQIGNWTINSAAGSMKNAFYGRTNFFVNDPTIGRLNMAGVTTLYRAFYNCKLSNTTDLGTWDVAAVTDFADAFLYNGGDNTVYTNLHIGNWTITATTVDMSWAFSGRTNFWTKDDDVGGWDVSSVTNFDSTFESNANFVGTGLDRWGLDSGVTNVDAMLKDTNVTTMPTSWFTGLNEVECKARWQSVFDAAGATSYNDVAFPTCTVAAAPPGPPGPAPAPTVAAAAGDDGGGGIGTGLIVGIIVIVVVLIFLAWARWCYVNKTGPFTAAAAMTDMLL